MWTPVSIDEPFVYKGGGYIVTITPRWTETSTTNTLEVDHNVVDDPDHQGIKPNYTGSEVRFRAPIYQPAAIAQFDNKSTAVGEAVLKWPVYASGDDCSDSAIKGYLILRMYRARITRMPGFDDSYKSASTFQFQLSAMDAKRDDGKIYELAYNENDL